MCVHLGDIKRIVARRAFTLDSTPTPVLELMSLILLFPSCLPPYLSDEYI